MEVPGTKGVRAQPLGPVGRLCRLVGKLKVSGRCKVDGDTAVVRMRQVDTIFYVQRCGHAVQDKAHMKCNNTMDAHGHVAALP